MFIDDKHIVAGGRRLRDIRVVDGGRMLALDIEQTDSRLLTLLIPTEEGLHIGTRLMVVAAEAKTLNADQADSREPSAPPKFHGPVTTDRP